MTELTISLSITGTWLGSHHFRLVRQPTLWRRPATVSIAATFSLNGLLTHCPSESVDLATSYVAQTDGYGQPSYSDQYWPAVGHQVQPHHTGFLSQDGSLADILASETSNVEPTPSSGENIFCSETFGKRTEQSSLVPLDYWGGNQSGPSTSTFYTVSARVRSSLCNNVNTFPQQNVQPLYQPSAGSTRAGSISTGRFRPYGMSRARTNEHRNAEAGPSTIVPPSFPYVGLSTLQPSGGISETTADAEFKQTDTEEYEVPVSNFHCFRIPRVPEGSFGVRRPNGPSSLVAKDHVVSTACACKKMEASCASGYDDGRGSPNFRA